MGKIIDTPWNVEKALTKLKNADVSTIIRYYNYNNSSTLPEKRLLPAEASAIHAADMTIAVVFQQRQNDPGDFTTQKGKDACERALELAGNVGQPAGSGIYFAVDRDFIKTAQLAAVVSFFEGVVEQMGGLPKAQRFKVGAYGSGKVLAHLKGKSLAKLLWLAQSTGWSGFKDFKDSNNWSLLQGPVTKIGGIDCDTNQANGDFGAF